MERRIVNVSKLFSSWKKGWGSEEQRNMLSVAILIVFVDQANSYANTDPSAVAEADYRQSDKSAHSTHGGMPYD